MSFKRILPSMITHGSLGPLLSDNKFLTLLGSQKKYKGAHGALLTLPLLTTAHCNPFLV
jgi:hypothetical protein